MGYPNWLAGEDITADKLNGLITAALKTTTQTVTSSTTFVDDTELKIPIVANAIYRVQLFLLYDAGTAGDIQFTWSAPSGTAMTWTPGGPATSENTSYALASMNNQTRLLTEVAAVGGSTSTGVMADVVGTLRSGATAGTLQFRWTQNVSSATPTNVRADSHLIATRIG